MLPPSVANAHSTCASVTTASDSPASASTLSEVVTTSDLGKSILVRKSERASKIAPREYRAQQTFTLQNSNAMLTFTYLANLAVGPSHQYEGGSNLSKNVNQPQEVLKSKTRKRPRDDEETMTSTDSSKASKDRRLKPSLRSWTATATVSTGKTDLSEC